jgi:predicted nucleic acid-binding Zn ribbon protein
MTSRRDEPVPLRDALAAVGRDLGVPRPDVLARITELWNDIAGPELAAHARVRSLRAGVCTIAADGPAWATPARYLGQPLAEHAEAVLGEGLVTAVQVVVEGSERPG